MSSSPPSESSQGLRKKQKLEANEFQEQINELQQEIEEVEAKLDAIHKSTDPVQMVSKECIEMKQRAAILKCKLAEHSHWVQRIGSLVEASPLLNVAMLLNTNQHSRPADGKDKPRLDLQLLDGWSVTSGKRQQTRVILEDRLQGAIEKCQLNASKLLDDAISAAPSSNAPLIFESRGWKVGTTTLMNNQVGFSCRRQLSGGSTHWVRDVAMAMFDFVQRDEIVRTFIPLVVDSTIAYQKEKSSCRENISNPAPPTKREVGGQRSKLDMHNKFSLSARVSKVKEGADILVVGSAQWDLSHCHDLSFSLLQYILGRIPVFEDIHLPTKATGVL